MKSLLAIAAALFMLQTAACSSVLGFDELAPKAQDDQVDRPNGAVTNDTVLPTAELHNTPAEAQDRAERFAEATCAYAEACDRTTLASVGTGANCQASRTGAARQLFAAGGVAVTDAALDACLSRLGKTCADRIDTIPECAFKGVRRDGDACTFAAQCASGACSAAVPNECGTCVPVVSAGDACTPASQCAAGTSCVAGTCRPLGAENASCAFHEDCRKDLVCANHACVRPPQEGDSCTSNGCDGSKNLVCTGGKCVAFQLRELGQSCVANGGHDVCVNSVCGSGNTCIPAGDRGERPASGQCAFQLELDSTGMCVEMFPSACR